MTSVRKLIAVSAGFWGCVLLGNACWFGREYHVWRTASQPDRGRAGAALARFRFPGVLELALADRRRGPGRRVLTSHDYLRIVSRYSRRREGFDALVAFVESGEVDAFCGVYHLRKFPRDWAWPQWEQWAASPGETGEQAIGVMLQTDLAAMLNYVQRHIAEGPASNDEDFSAWTASLCGKIREYDHYAGWSPRQRAAIAHALAAGYAVRGRGLWDQLPPGQVNQVFTLVLSFDDSPDKAEHRRLWEAVSSVPYDAKDLWGDSPPRE